MLGWQTFLTLNKGMISMEHTSWGIYSSSGLFPQWKMKYIYSCTCCLFFYNCSFGFSCSGFRFWSSMKWQISSVQFVTYPCSLGPCSLPCLYINFIFFISLDTLLQGAKLTFFCLGPLWPQQHKMPGRQQKTGAHRFSYQSITFSHKHDYSNFTYIRSSLFTPFNIGSRYRTNTAQVT